MLKLRRATVLRADDGEREQALVIELADAPADALAPGGLRRRPAVADVALVGRAQAGDELIVNTQALDLGLGSGGADIVHANLTRGLDSSEDRAGDGVMKLNYTSIQHTVTPVEDGSLALPLGRAVGVLALHGQLAPAAWSFARSAAGRKLGYIQTEGGALAGSHSEVVRMLRERGLLAGHLTAGAAFGGEGEAMSCAGALHHGLSTLGWDAAVCGPGPGIFGSGTPLGHGGMEALDSAHVALALGCRTLLVARISSGEARARHRGISHHTLTVLDLLLQPVTVALPAGMRSPFGAELRAGLGAAFAARSESDGGLAGSHSRPALAVEIELERPARITRHDWRRAPIDLPGYVASGLPAQTMGRTLAHDPLFFAAALAGGSALAELALEAARVQAEEHDEEAAGRVA